MQFECIVCYGEIKLSELVVCGRCHAAYHRDCLKMSFSDKKSKFYHCCAACTNMFSFTTLLQMNEMSKYELFNNLFARRSEATTLTIREVASIFRSIESSYVPYENTYALMCLYMDYQRFSNAGVDQSESMQGIETFIRIQPMPTSNDLIFAVVEAMKQGLYFVHSNFAIAESQWPILQRELSSFPIMKLSTNEFFDIYDLVSTAPSNRKFENLLAPKIEASSSIKTIWGHSAYPRFGRLYEIYKSMVDARMKKPLFPKFVKYISPDVQHLCAKLDCDGLVIHNVCTSCHSKHCSRCGRLEHEGLCEADDIINYGLIIDHKVICHNCRSYIKRTPKNIPNRWYCPICRKAFMIRDDKLYETQATFDQLIESISHNDVGPIIDGIFDYSSRTCMQLLSYLKKVNINMKSNVFYQFAQVFIQEYQMKNGNFINDTLIMNAVSKPLDSNLEVGTIPFSKSLLFMLYEFPGIIKNELIVLMKGIANGESFEQSLERMTTIMQMHNDIVGMYRTGIANERTDYYTKQLRPLIRKEDVEMQEWAKKNLI